MDSATTDALRLLDEVARTIPVYEPVQLDEGYLRMVQAVEALPQNQDGADKSWLWERLVAYREHFRAAEPPASWIHSRATPQP